MEEVGFVMTTLLGFKTFLIPFLADELLTPDDPDADPEPLMPSLPKSSPLALLPAPELALLPEKNDPRAAKG